MLSQRVIAIARGRSAVASSRASAIALSRAWCVTIPVFSSEMLTACLPAGRPRTRTPGERNSTRRGFCKVSIVRTNVPRML